MSNNAGIYEYLLRHCPAYRLPGHRPLFAADIDCRRCPEWGTATLAGLAERFTEYELVESGVAKELPDGMVLNAALVGAAQGVVALRATPDERPFALLTAAGILPNEMSPLAAIMRDHRTRSLLRARGSVLYAVFTIEELILLRAWGLPAVLAADLFYPVTARLSELASACGWATSTDQQPDACPEPDASEIMQPAAAAADPAADEAVADRPDAQPVAAAAFAAAGEASDAVDQSETGEEVQPAPEPAEESNSRAVDPFEVRILTWSPTTPSLDPPVGCEELLSQLLDAERHWGGNISEIAAWQPRPEQLDGIRRYLDRGSVSDAFAVISRSADHDLFALDFISRQIAAGRRPPLGFLDAQRELRASLGQTAAGRDAKKESAARTAYESAVDREIVAPIVAQAFSCTDPAKRSLGLAEAEFARAFHYAAPYVSGSPGGIAQGSLADANRLLTMAKPMLAVHREYKKR